MNKPMPSLFLAHGSPLLLDDRAWMSELSEWAQKLPVPKGILVMSAHWEATPVSISSPQPQPLYHDFYGFPARSYQVRYPSPDAQPLAFRLSELLGELRVNPQRGLDHGAYIPLIPMYPRADIPVLQLSISTGDPASLVRLGQRLAPLRKEGILLIGSGFLTHNMRFIDFSSQGRPPGWAEDFDGWCKDVLQRRDVDALVQYRQRGPGVRIALPTQEHFLPVLFSLGTSLGLEEESTFPIEGFTYGSFTKRSVQFG